MCLKNYNFTLFSIVVFLGEGPTRKIILMEVDNQSHGTTVIGLKRKKSCRPVPFTHKPRAEKQVVMLKWFVSGTVASDALKRGKFIEEEDVEVDPTKVSSPCLESFVNLDEVKHFFTNDGWLSVQNVIETKSTSPTWTCGSCLLDCSSGNTVLCECCVMVPLFMCWPPSSSKAKVLVLSALCRRE
ncbi:hypothetical protein JTE90_024223 [Oedothorax gibbosus]|uniref:Uncharacterized protein n=1 Tax=Oedothorax gibbosus TaxID=931172 RepID=A0AAV6TMX4_9ARAC|nr:hypothetical protein JTE90_024223 [Oedothorax gibbosus]